jgi:hypothetical protein
MKNPQKKRATAVRQFLASPPALASCRKRHQQFKLLNRPDVFVLSEPICDFMNVHPVAWVYIKAIVSKLRFVS